MIHKLREPINSLTHLFAALAAAGGTAALLILGRGRLTNEISLAIYGASLTLLFVASAAYHGIRSGSRGTAVLRQLDHSAIFLLIAGTYTPFCIIAFDGFWKWGLLAIIWTLAIAGITVKIFLMRAPRWITAGMYIVMGWLCVAALGEMLRVLPAGAMIWLTAGGVLYTVGAIIYITRTLDFYPGRFGFHEIWHIFVMLAALAHFIAIAGFLAGHPPGA